MRLVVVTKGQPLEKIMAVVSAGARCLGENYVEEALPKIAALGNLKDLEWHMIGHVQSRKASSVSEHFDWVHSVDSVKIARRLSQFAGQAAHRLSIILECNISGEAAKFGWPAWEEHRWSELANEVESLRRLENLEIRGLMTMPPFSTEPEDSRPYFIMLRNLQGYLINRFPDVSWGDLSMGMSADYVVAIQEGATIVRIGTAILGERE